MATVSGKNKKQEKQMRWTQKVFDHVKKKHLTPSLNLNIKWLKI